ncbi:hypothetical protein SAMN05216345_11817 [Cupriavidus sp. YR651]|uniref:hypothetical protein n=1 Tax=Cupriavidus sp. YR651 TaxID=1855315 RepID=UPI00088CDAD2|nr:hypothetical protein [Cupriavidus sp. YR651]SDD84462.1 hypothetical protein SAMN05216345_11817 [Cupriavidus sp. YR651]
MTVILQPGTDRGLQVSVRHHRSLAMRVIWVMRKAAAALALGAASLPNAQTLVTHPKPPEIHQSAGVRYASGGIGRDAVRQMLAIAGQFNVRLSFQEPSGGRPVSAVTLILANEKGDRLLRVVSDGPLVYLKLPHGRYYMTVIYQDTEHEQWITAEAKPLDLTFLFNPIHEEQDRLQADAPTPQYPSPT